MYEGILPPRELDLIDSVLIKDEAIVKRCEELAEQIFNDYKGLAVDIFVVGKAALPFYNELTKGF